MKNNRFLTWCVAVMLSLATLPMQAQTSPTASKKIFDWTPFEDSKMLNLFYNALQQGRNYPTEQEFRNAFGFDIEFARSHVRPRNVVYNQAKQLNTAINPKRKVWMNIPTGIGKEIGGYPSATFIDDVYSTWQYTHLFGAWNHGLFQAPGVWADAAHKHGTDIFSGIKFFESWTSGSGDQAYSALISQKNQDGSYKYAEPLINVLMYLGLDGINYNWEDGSYTNADVIAFHKELYRIADLKGFTNFHIGLYTAISSLTTNNAASLYYGNKPTEKTIDLMLNYSGGDFAAGATTSSINAAKSVTGQTDHLYSGVWIVSMDRSWTAMNAAANREMNLCLWGEHGQSRFMSYNAGTDGYNIQENYQKLLERAFSGGNRNPAKLPTLANTGNNWEQSGTKEPLSSFGGLATMIAERTTIQGKLPFITNFQLGNGERYNYKGKKAFGNWYNMGAQDYQPTFRWLVYNGGTKTVSTDIQPSYTHRDAYNGGSTLELKGTATTAGTDIVLYRTDLEIGSANPKVNVAVKTYKEGNNPTNLYVILKKKDNDTWFEIPVGDTNGKNWEEKILNMNGFATGEHIEYIGLRVKAASTTSNYQIYVGKLGLTDDREVKVANVENLLVEVKEETQKSMSLKLNWKVTPFENSSKALSSGLVYNDEANVDHFEILYKNGENGQIKAIGRTSSWSTFIGGITFNDATNPDEPYIGVRAASIDGKSYSVVNWVRITRANSSQLPAYADDRYCKSEINPVAEGADIARAQRYLTEVKTTNLADNLNYTASAPVADGTQYANATAYSFTANQGETVNLFFKAFDSSSKNPIDGLRYCFAKAFIDWNNNGDFEPDTETVFDLGTARKGTPEFETTGVTKSFTVPEKAAPGAVRLRIVFSDAWFTHPGPCGLTAKGFSIDFTMNVTGSNTPDPVVDKRDQGTPVEPDRVRDANPNAPDANSGVETVLKGGFSFFYPNPAKDVIHFNEAEEIWIYTLDGKLVLNQNTNLDNVSVSKLEKGSYLVKMLNKSVVRSAKLIKN